MRGPDPRPPPTGGLPPNPFWLMIDVSLVILILRIIEDFEINVVF